MSEFIPANVPRLFVLPNLSCCELQSNIWFFYILFPFQILYSTMSEFIVESEYSVYMKLSDKKLVGSVVGSEGSNKRFIESQYGCKIDANLDDGTIRIVGKVEEKV